MNSPQATRKTQLKNDTFGPVSRLLKRDFVIIEVGIMGISKGNLEPVKGSRLPVKVRKDINQGDMSVRYQKHCDHDHVFSNLEKYVLLYSDKK